MPITPDTRLRTEALIKSDEGCKLVAYQDTRGIWTIGYGYNIVSQLHCTPTMASTMRWTQEQADNAFEVCFNRCLASLDANFYGWDNLDPARQAVAVSAMYVLGVKGVFAFAPTIRLITDGQFDQAADHLRASAWDQQAHARVERLATMLQTGEWPS